MLELNGANEMIFASSFDLDVWKCEKVCRKIVNMELCVRIQLQRLRRDDVLVWCVGGFQAEMFQVSIFMQLNEKVNVGCNERPASVLSFTDGDQLDTKILHLQSCALEDTSRALNSLIVGLNFDIGRSACADQSTESGCRRSEEEVVR